MLEIRVLLSPCFFYLRVNMLDLNLAIGLLLLRDVFDAFVYYFSRHISYFLSVVSIINYHKDCPGTYLNAINTYRKFCPALSKSLLKVRVGCLIVYSLRIKTAEYFLMSLERGLVS